MFPFALVAQAAFGVHWLPTFVFKTAEARRLADVAEKAAAVAAAVIAKAAIETRMAQRQAEMERNKQAAIDAANAVGMCPETCLLQVGSNRCIFV